MSNESPHKSPERAPSVWQELAELRESRADLEAGRRLFAAKRARQERLSHMRVRGQWRDVFAKTPRIVVAGVAIGTLAVLMVMSGLAIHGRWASNAHSGPETTYATHNGQRAEITLADGTVVTLNVASRLEVPEQFSAGNRTVRLTGEADFQVLHHTNVPLVVDAGNTQTRVLGTEFSVRAYRKDDVRVVVRNGKVAVNNVVLGARDIARVTPAGQVGVVRGQAVDALFGFTTGRMSFVDVPLARAIPDLDRWYDVDIQLGDRTLGALPLDAVLSSGSIGDLIEILRVTFDVRVVRVGRTLTLYPG